MSEINALPAPLSLAEWRSAGEYFDFNGQRIFYRCAGESTTNPNRTGAPIPR